MKPNSTYENIARKYGLSTNSADKNDSSSDKKKTIKTNSTYENIARKYLSNPYYDVLDAEDFDEYVQKGASVANPSWNAAHAPLEIGGWTPFGDGEDIVNMVTFAETNKGEATKASGQAFRGGGSSKYSEIVDLINSYMKEDEKRIYNYYVGKGDTEKANEYLTYITDKLKQRQGGVIAEQVDEKFLLEGAFSLAAGVDQFASGVKNIDNFIKGTESDPTTSMQYAYAGTEDYAGTSSNNKGLRKVANDLAYTTGNMLPSILVGSVTGGLGGALTMGVSSVGNAYSEMRNLGYNEWQARGYGLLVGASETALQYALGGISPLGSAKGGIFSKATEAALKKVDNALGRLAIEVGSKMFDEGFEEAAQSVLEPIFKSILTGEAVNVDWGEVAYSGLLGALSGGMLEGAPTIAGTAIDSIDTAVTYGKASLKNAFDAFKTNRNFGDVKAAYNQGKSEFKENASYLVDEALDIDPSNAHAQRMKTKLDSGKNISGYQVNRLIEANEDALVSQDKGKIKAAAESKLTEYGEKGDVGKVSDVITKIRSGEKITKAESKILTDSTFGRRVSTEMNPDIIKDGTHNTSWVKDIGTERIGADVYNRDGDQTIFTLEKAKANIVPPDDEEKEEEANIEALEGDVKPI